MVFWTAALLLGFRQTKAMHKMLMTGHAETSSGAFDFELGYWIDGIGLTVRDTGAGDKGFNGAGIWPTIEKAQQIADQTVKHLLDPDCVIVWTSISN
jgi:hypothetical protein